MRACRACGEEKPETSFKLERRESGVRALDCNKCRYQKEREPALRRANSWRVDNKERIRETRYQRDYGVGIDWYDQKLEAQGGGCAICGSTDHKRKNVKYFAIDHDHETGAARGVLCHPCNVGLGMLGGSIEGLRRAINYLEEAA